MSKPSKRKHVTAHIATLDPVKDHQEIVFLLSCHAFSWDTERALEFGLFRTYAVPSISKLLSKTGEFKNRPQKRYDDTELIMYEMLENGYDSDRAKEAFKRLNGMHNSFNISNDDFLYVLTTFMYTPIYWVEKYGWRKLTQNERLSVFLFFREVGKRMNIKDIPDDYDTFEKFHHQYEQDNFRFSETNREIGIYTRNLILSFYLPKSLAFIGKPFVACFMDEQLIAAMGFRRPPKILKIIVKGIMNLRAGVVRYLPERKSPRLGTQVKRATYPEGYEIDELGTRPKAQKEML
ncbi:MAG: DUF2236 domain-containing protein [Flavobacteriales bacterium]|nr:DUF2236 domain-containing protein [Flavobacteriales bacterium]MBL4734501.1 DUF2236 domain-containing protein [Flavobacteriales bacterium]